MTANTLTPTFCRICEPLCPLVAETDGRGHGGGAASRSRAPGVGRLRVPQGHVVPPGPPRSEPPRPPAPARQPEVGAEWSLRAGHLGRRVRRDRRAAARHPGALRPRGRRLLLGQPARLHVDRHPDRVRVLGEDAVDPAVRRADPGPLQQVRGDGRDVRRRGDVPGARPLPHRLLPLPRERSEREPPHRGVGSRTRSTPSAGIRERGGGVTFVNPRRIRAVELGLGDHLQIRPDTDLYFLAAMLTEIDRLGGWDEEAGRASTAATSTVCAAFIAPFDADSVAPRHRTRSRRTSGAPPVRSPPRPPRSPTWGRAATWVDRARSSTGCCRCSTS